MKLSQILSAVGLAPKDLEQARNTIEPAKAALEQVNALFTNAGLNLEAMLETGPDALKAHIESLGNSDEELAAALLKADKLGEENVGLNAKLESLKVAIADTGFAIVEGADMKAAFADHVKKAAAVELAKAGHPPVAVVNVDQKTATQSEIYATWKAMAPGDEYYDAKVKVLGEYIKHHVKEEEQPGGIFSQAKKGDEDLEAMGERMKARKEELMAELGGPPTN